jgi:hypothetical protein
MKLSVHVAPAQGGTRHDDVDRPDGPALAVLVAAGLGAFTLGLLTTWAEASETMKERLTLYDPVGPLSGKSSFAVLVFLASWVVLHPVLRKVPRLTERHLLLVGGLVILGVLGTFPPIFQLFTAE